MIDLKKAKLVFNEYVNNYDQNDDKVILKISHTYRVMERCQEIAASLNLDDENIQLAGLIGLLHDIGRFEQLKRYQSFIDSQTIDHANLGVTILFDDNLIEKFEIDKKYYPIIKTAIYNHNKYEIETGLESKTDLHCRIIRDGDKIDIFKTGLLETFEAFLGTSQFKLEHDVVTVKVFRTFMSCKTVLSTDRKTDLDRWVSFLALVFGLEFEYSLEYVNSHRYIIRLMDRLDIKDADTRLQMQQMKNCCIDFLSINAKS